MFEILFQILFIFNLSFIKQPILYYNGYCDQKYWLLNEKKIKFNENILPHKILSFQKKSVFIPNKFENLNEKVLKKFSKNQLSFFGSSYINHQEVVNIIAEYEDLTYTNYALESYGLDQIYLSYKLTSHLNHNKTIVFGFLLEDLDRSIFNYREYQKAQFIMKNNNFELKNIPIDQNLEISAKKDFYLYRFLSNFYSLIINNFDPRKSECQIENKKELFKFFFDDIIKEADKLNQKIIVITFNLKEDLNNEPTWRYEYMKNYFAKNNILHIDSLQIMKNKSVEYNEKIDDYFGRDAHNNQKSFRYIFDEFEKIYNAM